MQRFFKLATFVCLLFLSTTIFSQEYYFKHYKVENGMSNNTVLASIQDKDGFLWFGTKDGLNRFDGYHFKTFRSGANPKTSLGINYIQSLHEFKNFIWVGTDKGLYSYDKKLEKFTFLNEAINNRINDIDNDFKNNLWFISIGTLVKYNVDTKQTTMFDGRNSFYATSITCDKNGVIWASSYDDLYRYSEATQSFDKIAVQLPDSTFSISVIYALDENSILIGTRDHGVYKYDIPSRKTSTFINGPERPIFIRQFKKNKNELWIASESGVSIYNLKDKRIKNLRKSPSDPYAISDNAAYCITIDKENGVWIGTYFGGVNYHQKQYDQFKKYFPRKSENAIVGSAVREIHKDNQGNLWIGTEDAGINKFNLQTKKFINFQPDGTKSGLSFYNIHAVLPRENKIWIGTFEHGLDIMDAASGKVVKHYDHTSSNLRSDFIVTFYETPEKKLYVVTSLGIYLYDDAADSFKISDHFSETTHYTCMFKDKDGNFWAGSYRDGLFYYNSKTKEKAVYRHDFNNDKSISNDFITSIFQDQQHNLWIATENGLNLFDTRKKEFTKFTTKDGFPSNVIYSILQDDKQNLCITTSKGLVKFNYKAKSVKIFSTANGLLSDQFNYNSAFKDSNGDMYFGNLNGMISFNPKNFGTYRYNPPIFITGLQINNQDVVVNDEGSPLDESVSYIKKITLKNYQSNFNIDFASLSYTAPELTQYWYKLDGINDDWVYLNKNNKVFFTELPSGDYKFRVKSLSANGIWSREAVVAIAILPPFWASSYAFFFYFLIISGCLYWLLRRYHNINIKENNQKIAILNNEKEIYHAKFEFFTNVAHEIRTPLTLIKSPLESLLKRTYESPEILQNLSIMEKNTSRLLNLVNELLDFRKTEIEGLGLTFVETNISVLVKQLQSQFTPLIEEKNIDFELELGERDIYAFVDEEAITKILSNLISNAVKYAKSKVIITLFRDENSLEFIVKNDGNLIPKNLKNKIFEPFFRILGSETQTGTGIGLSLAHSLTELHNGTLKLQFLDDSLNTFVLQLPLRQQSEFHLYKDTSENTVKETSEEFESEITAKNIKTQILIVEDNLELLNFMSKELSKEYKIFKAANGEEALKVIHNQTIHIVISDITMPVMDGIELCGRIKSNIETSHIPVILLTALSAVQSRIKGLESGADAYISKPFSMDFILAQIDNLLSNRRHVMEFYASSPLSHLKTIAHNKVDEDFIKKLDDIIDQNMADTNLSVDSLADILHMSRSTLYRKIKDISNLSPNELINNARLKKAASLLLSGKYKVYEISEIVGYNSQSSFSRNFQKSFSMSPSEFINNGGKDLKD
ncbi:hybrid sensor histidine kinase/response regulator transcription factor [Flavobacterium reichenbachii]|uniref:histidine kinase n=1 Tax=Flavobacterium reichenbachii TaxID=362418 RepID=A0A085ZPM4_9FLAO|nr:hybrid sensor histidine kinase/response regulator transcription factor [Flavobacterium reichenbachii]KFF06388.1 histidine kinase [Flavobacterium reichenbachii]